MTPPFESKGLKAAMFKIPTLQSGIELIGIPFDIEVWVFFWLLWFFYGFVLYLIAFLAKKVNMDHYGPYGHWGQNVIWVHHEIRP